MKAAHDEQRAAAPAPEADTTTTAAPKDAVLGDNDAAAAAPGDATAEEPPPPPPAPHILAQQELARARLRWQEREKEPFRPRPKRAQLPKRAQQPIARATEWQKMEVPHWWIPQPLLKVMMRRGRAALGVWVAREVEGRPWVGC